MIEVNGLTSDTSFDLWGHSEATMASEDINKACLRKFIHTLDTRHTFAKRLMHLTSEVIQGLFWPPRPPPELFYRVINSYITLLFLFHSLTFMGLHQSSVEFWNELMNNVIVLIVSWMSLNFAGNVLSKKKMLPSMGSLLCHQLPTLAMCLHPHLSLCSMWIWLYGGTLTSPRFSCWVINCWVINS